MKRVSTILSVAAVCLLTFVGCKKDSSIVTFGVRVENAASENKLYIDDDHNPVFFDNGEEIHVNGVNYSVVKQGSQYIVTVENNEDGNYYACYPTSIVTSAGIHGATAQPLHLSRWQAYTEAIVGEGTDQVTKQNVQLPAVASIVDGGSQLKFYNLCSLLEVNWTNSSSDAYDVIGIEVTVPGAVLYGDATASIDGTNSQITMTSSGEKYNRVNLDIPEGSRETVAANGISRNYYVVLPPFSNEKVTVRIFVMKHSQTTSDDQKLRTITVGTDQNVTLPRNYIVPMHISATPKEDNALSGYFSIRGDGQGNDTYKVVFSRGNLQHVGSNNPSTGTWKFADRQYDFFGANNLNTGGYNVSNSVDLFGWSNTDDYSAFGMYVYDDWNDPDWSSNFKDWGDYKTISGDAAGTWFTLSSNEWYYLFHSRVNGNGENLVGKALITGIAGHPAGNNVTSIQGFILVPDDWTADNVPSGLTFTPGLASDASIVNEYTASEWARMEAAGAIFLPAAGWGSNYSRNSNGSIINNTYQDGQYWSSTKKTGYEESHYLAFTYTTFYWYLQTSTELYSNTTVSSNYDMDWWYLRSVRLVKPAPGYSSSSK